MMILCFRNDFRFLRILSFIYMVSLIDLFLLYIRNSGKINVGCYFCSDHFSEHHSSCSPFLCRYHPFPVNYWCLFIKILQHSLDQKWGYWLILPPSWFISSCKNFSVGWQRNYTKQKKHLH
jgi:hypothetical protein